MHLTEFFYITEESESRLHNPESETFETTTIETIRKVGDKYRLYSRKGKNLGTYDSHKDAEKREQQVNYFKHLSESVNDFPVLHSILKEFLPFAANELGLDQIPKIKIKHKIAHHGQASFGCFKGNSIELGIDDRHPIDICRTLAHELVHFKQDLNKQLNNDSGETGSPEENEANSTAGIIMRKFNKKYPQFISGNENR